MQYCIRNRRVLQGQDYSEADSFQPRRQGNRDNPGAVTLPILMLSNTVGHRSHMGVFPFCCHSNGMKPQSISAPSISLKAVKPPALAGMVVLSPKSSEQAGPFWRNYNPCTSPDWLVKPKQFYSRPARTGCLQRGCQTAGRESVGGRLW